MFVFNVKGQLKQEVPRHRERSLVAEVRRNCPRDGTVPKLQLKDIQEGQLSSLVPTPESRRSDREGGVRLWAAELHAGGGLPRSGRSLRPLCLALELRLCVWGQLARFCCVRGESSSMFWVCGASVSGLSRSVGTRTARRICG